MLRIWWRAHTRVEQKKTQGYITCPDITFKPVKIMTKGRYNIVLQTLISRVRAASLFSWSVEENATLGARGFSRVRREFSVLAEGRHIFGRRPKPREKPLARSGAFYRSRWPLCLFIGLHLRQSDWKSPTVIMWACTWRSVQRPTLSLAKQVRV